jgi:hypothetical protein
VDIYAGVVPSIYLPEDYTPIDDGCTKISKENLAMMLERFCQSIDNNGCNFNEYVSNPVDDDRVIRRHPAPQSDYDKSTKYMLMKRIKEYNSTKIKSYWSMCKDDLYKKTKTVYEMINSFEIKPFPKYEDISIIELREIAKNINSYALTGVSNMRKYEIVAAMINKGVEAPDCDRFRSRFITHNNITMGVKKIMNLYNVVSVIDALYLVFVQNCRDEIINKPFMLKEVKRIVGERSDDFFFKSDNTTYPLNYFNHDDMAIFTKRTLSEDDVKKVPLDIYIDSCLKRKREFVPKNPEEKRMLTIVGHRIKRYLKKNPPIVPIIPFFRDTILDFGNGMYGSVVANERFARMYKIHRNEIFDLYNPGFDYSTCLKVGPFIKINRK